MKNYRCIIEDMMNFLRNFSVEEKKNISWYAMELINDELQSIEHDLKEVDKYSNHIDSVASDLEEEKK